MSEPKFTIMDDILFASGIEPGNLEHAIAKWQFLVKFGYSRLKTGGRLTCALCLKYNRFGMDNDSRCIGCPVKARTGFSSCINTPYDELGETGVFQRKTKKKWRELAQKEVDFLVSLRDKEN